MSSLPITTQLYRAAVLAKTGEPSWEAHMATKNAKRAKRLGFDRPCRTKRKSACDTREVDYSNDNIDYENPILLARIME
jgi:hypothetical protein